MARALPATWRAAPLTLAVVVLALVAGATCDTPTATPADAKTTVAPAAVISIATEAPKSNGSASTVKPHGVEPAPTIAVALAPTGAPSATTSKPTAAAAAPAAPATTPAAAPDATPGQRVAQYFEPVCTYLERLKPKQMFKIQAQMKQFVEKTAGKMSMCFLQHYSMDPNLAPVSKAQLEAICASRALEPGAKNSFAAFLACTTANYDAALDAELARINRARAAHTPNRAAGANDTLASLAHDDDELSLISEVVDKVMADSKEGKAPPKPDIKVIEAPPAAPGGQSPTAAPGAKAPFAELMANKTILHDPNTMILFVDESNSTAAAAANSTAKPPLFIHSTPAPIKVTLITHPSNATSSAKPTSLADKIVAAAAKTTAAPAPGVVITNSTTVVTVAPTTTGKPAASTTAAPAKAGSTTPPPPPPPAPKSTTTTTKPPATSTSARPLKTLEKVLDRQDSERSKLDSKLKKEREQLLKAAQKDDSEAKKAIKALQAQRAQAHGSPADARMHQIEHERQMSIDPVGHTTKHKEYELKKAAKSTSTTTTSTTAKPKE